MWTSSATLEEFIFTEDPYVNPIVVPNGCNKCLQREKLSPCSKEPVENKTFSLLPTSFPCPLYILIVPTTPIHRVTNKIMFPTSLLVIHLIRTNDRITVHVTIPTIRSFPTV